MLPIKSKKRVFLLCFSLLCGFMLPGLIQADSVNAWGGDSGSIDAGKAAAQREAIAKRKEKIKKRQEAEAQKASEAQQVQPVEEKKPMPTATQ